MAVTALTQLCCGEAVSSSNYLTDVGELVEHGLSVCDVLVQTSAAHVWLCMCVLWICANECTAHRVALCVCVGKPVSSCGR